jgi:hypothetical protein
MFHRRNGEHSVALSQFSGWDLYQERDRDITFKRIIEDLGVSVKPWTTVCWVGNIGLYYDFSPQVLAGICERRQVAKAKRESAALASPVKASKVTC